MTADSDCAECLVGEAARRKDWPDKSAAVSNGLADSGRFEETYEWRISTYTTRGVERSERGYRVWSETDGTWEAVVSVEQEALAAYFVLSGLQQSLFHAIGWASWAAARQLTVDDPPRPWSPSPRDECERYLALLWIEGRDRARGIAEEAAAIIESGGSWRSGRSILRPAPDPGQPGRSTWIEAHTSSLGLQFTSASPTAIRAAEFIPVYEGLASDIPRELGWQMPGA